MNGTMNVTRTFTIFGGTGDLAFRKLLPAFYNMSCLHQLQPDFHLVIVGRKPYTKDEYMELVKNKLKQFSRFEYREEEFLQFCKYVDYFKMNISDIEDYHNLDDYYKKHQLSHHIFYMAVAPAFFIPIADGLSHIHHTTNNKVIIEKPFGENLKTALLLNEQLETRFKREDIYHIDHYLGKEMIQNIAAIRFENMVFANVWNNVNIDYVEISALEEIGVENRGAYYDKSGALKDMVQNHLFQILTIIAAEGKLESDEGLHEQQVKVLKALRPISALNLNKSVVLGQYEGYLEEPHVDEISKTETFAALKLFIDNERWMHVPFYLKTGKCLSKRDMEVVIQFKRTSKDVEGDRLVIKIQPREGVFFEFNIKTPGVSNDLTRVKMDFCQSCMELHPINTPEAYERLLLAAMNSDKDLFSKWDQIALGWNYIHDLTYAYREKGLQPYVYACGSEGPIQSKQLYED